MIQVSVFTHPVCSGCHEALQMALRLKEEHPDVDLHIVSLGSAEGREKAKAAGVLSVPTLFIGATRIVGVPVWDELVGALEAGRAGDGRDSTAPERIQRRGGGA